MARQGQRTASPAEYDSAPRHEGDATYFTRRISYDDLAVVIRRFPVVEGAVGGGRPIVLVHGIGVSSRYFHPVAALLARRATVYLVDLPGYGSAPKPRRPVSIADHAAVLARYLSAEGIVHPVLVGHSMGTQVITRLALEDPQLTDRLVLIAPTMDPAARTFWRAGGRLLGGILRYEPLRVNLLVSIDYFFRCGIPYFLRQLPYLLGDRIEDRLPLLAVRALVIRGDRDVISPHEWASTVTALLRDARLATVEGPHVVMFTDPERVSALITEHASA